MPELKPGVFSVGAVDWDRRLFDELIPLPDGTSYNCYLVRGAEKTALMDTVDPAMSDVLVSNLIKHGVEKIDYVICHHCEQDHSGTIPNILLLYPQAQVVTNPKCRAMLVDHLHIEADRIIEVSDGQVLGLGGKGLRFIYTPWVHWPETMCSYLEEDGILFSCDFFGSHLATSRLFVEDYARVYSAAKRYYAEIMMPFRKAVAGNIRKVEGLRIDMIAPSHGPVYDKPEFIIDAYRDWVGDAVKNQVIVAYVSMHGSTRKMVGHFVETLGQMGIEARQFNLPGTDIGELAMSLVDAATLVIGTPTVLAGPHPAAAYAAVLANALRPKTRFLSVIASCGWAGKAVEGLKGLAANMNVEILEPVIVKGLARDEDFVKIDELAGRILEAHRGIGIA